MRPLMAWNWWTLTIRGLVAILFGVFTFFWPAVTLTVLALLFGAYALVDGIFNVVSAVRGGPDQERWWVILLQGVISLGAGLLTAFWPAITVLALIYVLAAWAILTGLLELAAAVKLRQYITGEWLLALAGVASVVFGLLLIVQPFAGAIVVAWWIGAYALIFGAILIGLSFRLRAWSRSVEPQRG
ncbi:MAG TPA: HdeD family acid-resistance protein [Bryobacteraceae bacterium]|nr:HdeD family acid-resistance protein [Bryobacteraceae bacterium]